MKGLFLLLGVLLLTGCAAVQERIVTHVRDDFTQVAQIAEIANKPEVKSCADYLVGLVTKLKSGNELLAKLDAIDTSGNLFASAFKAYVTAEAQRTAGDELLKDVEKNFSLRCGAVRTQIEVNVIKAIARR